MAQFADLLLSVTCLRSKDDKEFSNKKHKTINAESIQSLCSFLKKDIKALEGNKNDQRVSNTRL